MLSYNPGIYFCPLLSKIYLSPYTFPFFSLRQPFVALSTCGLKQTQKSLNTVGIVLSSDIKTLIRDSIQGDREARAALYRQFYNYGMSICLRYSRDREEAKEIVNDGFLKIFAKLDKYDPKRSFQGWIRRIMINASIDFYRRNQKHYHQADLEAAHHIGVAAKGLSSLTEQEIMDAVQQLPPSYRMVFQSLCGRRLQT